MSDDAVIVNIFCAKGTGKSILSIKNNLRVLSRITHPEWNSQQIEDFADETYKKYYEH